MKRLVAGLVAGLSLLTLTGASLAQSLKIASPQRGSWEGAIPELGKQAGILLAVLGCERAGLGKRPEGAGLLHLWGMALLCGIGFTMSLFIGALAFPRAPDLVEEAKLGVLAGSLISALLGAVILRLAPAKPVGSTR